MDPAQAAAAQTAAEQQAAAEHAAAEVVAAQQSAAREAAGKAAAEAANLAWRTNTGPVLPAYADQQPTFTAYDTLGKPYQVSAAQDAANEAAKYAQFNSPIDYGRYANVPLVQMPAGLAGPVQEYYREHPTPAFQSLTGQYSQQHNAIVSSSGTLIPVNGGFYNVNTGEMFHPTVTEPTVQPKYQPPNGIGPSPAGVSPIAQAPPAAPTSLINPASLFAIPGMMAITQGTTMAEAGIRGFFTGLTTGGDLIAPSWAPVTHFTLGVIEAFPETFMAGAYLIPAGAAILTQPTAFASAIIPGAIQSGSQLITQATEDPFRFGGNLVGMLAFGHVMGRITETGAPYIAEKISGASPFDLRIGTPLRAATEGDFNYVTTLGTRMPFSTEPATVRGFAITGVDVEGIKIGFGAPTAAMRELTITADPVFNVRDMGGVHVMTESQRLILDPFFRDVSRGTPEEQLVNAVFDMKANIGANVRGGSETTLKYTNAQPAGTLTQTDIDPSVQFQVHEILADVGATRLGSAAQTDWLGPRFMRDTTGLDIDVDVPKVNYPKTIEGLKEAYSLNTEPVRMSARGGKFSLMKNPESETIISPGTIEKFADVRSLEAMTASGKTIGQQTPEYGIESKASRSLGGRLLQYDPENGLEVTTHETKGNWKTEWTRDENGVVTRTTTTTGKFSKDIADIYAASRGIARTAYEQNQFEMGRTYESIADNLNAYAKSRGMDTMIRTIPEDILGTPEAIKAKTIAGIKSGAYRTNIFGVDLPDFRTTDYDYPTVRYVETVEPADYMYPISILPGTGQAGRSTSAAAITGQDNYPEATRLIRNDITGYPASYSISDDLVGGYPGAIYTPPRLSEDYPLGNVGGDRYPTGGYIGGYLGGGGHYPSGDGGGDHYPAGAGGGEYTGGSGGYTGGGGGYTGSGGGSGGGGGGNKGGGGSGGNGGGGESWGGGTEVSLITKLPLTWQISKRRKRPARFLELFSFEEGLDTPIPVRFGLGGVNRRATGQRPARFLELFSLEQGQDTPVPYRFGKGGVNVRAASGNPTAAFIPGYRGTAAQRLRPEDIAPNGLFDILDKGPQRLRKVNRNSIGDKL